MKNILKITVLLVVLLAGCTSKESEVASKETRTYKSLSGEVELPKEPQRIVSDYYCGDLLALETNVVGCDLTYKSPSWDTTGITDIGQSTEKVASLNPDLIITFKPDNYQVFKDIAPTVLIPYGSYNEEDLVMELGEITNTVEKAQELTHNFSEESDKLKDILAKNYDLDKTTFSTIEAYGEDAYVYGNTWSRFGYVMYDKMGLKIPETAKAKLISDDPAGETYLALTEELINDYIGDVVLVSTPTGEPVDNPIIDSETFKNTEAAKNKQVFYVKADLFYNNDMLSLMDQIETIESLVGNAE